MTDQTRRRALAAAIHETDTKLVLAVAGGGNAAITDLLDVPGASRTVLEILIPYAEPSLVALLADQPGATAVDLESVGAVSRTTAETMAASCLHRARRLGRQPVTTGLPPLDETALIGVGCTAALVSDRPKRGDHRAHIAVAGGDRVEHRHVALRKGDLDRAGEDRVVADAVLDMIAAACGVDRDLAVSEAGR